MAIKKKTNSPKVAIVKIPLSAFRCISSYPKDKKVVCEINTKDLETINDPKTVDEIINAGRLDYALGKYKAFNSSKKLITELRS